MCQAGHVVAVVGVDGRRGGWVVARVETEPSPVLISLDYVAPLAPTLADPALHREVEADAVGGLGGRAGRLGRHDALPRLGGELQAVYFEEVRRHASTDSAHVYGGLMATLTAWCEHHKIPYQGVPVGTIKKHATGKGNADKVAMIDAIRLRGHPVTDDNEADALALLYWALECNV